jgi:predicted CoA-substrate-specific enzyme activase
MKKYCLGIDSGSTMCKTVLFEGMNIVDTLAVKTGWNPKLSAEESFGVLLNRHGLNPEAVLVSATGYGREAVDTADYAFTEITCHAFGGLFLRQDIQGIIDIGGQDSKVIHLQDGRISDFLMNDKCAAGTGRFFSMACDTLGIPMAEIDNFSDSCSAVSITSMCTVFAESEIIGLLAMRKDREQIMTGVLQSIAAKIRQQAGKMHFAGEQPLLMTGGLSSSDMLVQTISQAIGLKVVSHPYALYAGAIGAAVCAMRKSG